MYNIKKKESMKTTVFLTTYSDNTQV